MFSEAGFDMEKIHLKVRNLSLSALPAGWPRAPRFELCRGPRLVGTSSGAPGPAEGSSSLSPPQRNAAVAQLYEDAIKYEGAVIADSGALINFSGKSESRSRSAVGQDQPR